MTASIETVGWLMVVIGVFLAGMRAGRVLMARDEFAVLRGRIHAAPDELLHMASSGVTPAIEALTREAFAIAHGTSKLPLRADHIKALILLHADAVRHYDKLGDELTAATRRRRAAEAMRDRLAAWIATSVQHAADHEARIDRFPAKLHGEGSHGPFVLIGAVDAAGMLTPSGPMN